MKFLVFLLVLISTLYSQESIEVSYYEDKTATQGFNKIVFDEADAFSKLTKIKFGYTDAAVWLKVTCVNNTEILKEKVLLFRDVRLDDVKVYDENGILLYHMGDMLPFKNRYFNDPKIAIPLTLDPHSKITYYLRFLNWTKMNLEYGLVDKYSYINQLNQQNFFEAFFFGAIIIMLIYNLMLFVFLRERAILDYVIYHLALLVLMLYYNGAIGQFIYRDSAGLDAGTMSIHLAAICTLLATQFARSFLNTKKVVPRIDKILLSFILLNIFAVAESLIRPFLESYFDYNHYFFNIIMIFQSMFLLFTAIYMIIKKKSRIAVFYFLGWFTMMLGIITTGLVVMNVIQRNMFTSDILQIGVLVEITLLSMGLAYRYKINQDQLIEKTQVLHEQSKLAAMGEMMRHISHQWRQPLSEINSVAMKIETDHRKDILDDVSLDRNIEQIENITEHMSKTIQDFNSYFKSDKAKTKTTLEAVVDKALALVMGGLSKNDIHIDKAVEVAEIVEIVDGELVQVLLVLLNNARDALKASDVPEKWIKIRIAKENSKHLIEVEDSAGGIAEENLAKVFEPYFTTKFEAQGVGIGLYMSKMIVEESLGGSLSVINGSHGAKFTVVLSVL